jgi:antirestriction protein
MMWSERFVNHVFVFYNGTLIYKRYCKNCGKGDCTEKDRSSMIFNENWPNVLVKNDPGEGTNENGSGGTPPP